MPDLGPVGSILEIGAPILRRAFAAFASSALATAVLGLGVCAVSFLFASKRSTLHGVFALAIALALFTALGLVLAVKRAILAALLHGFEKLQLGERTTRALFLRILAGETGAAIQRAAERVPLDVAEGKLRGAVDALVAEDRASGLFRRRIRAAAIDKVAIVTLARFRDEGARHGGVDLVKVRDELAARIDQLVVDAIGGAALKLSATLLGAATACSLLAAYVLR